MKQLHSFEKSLVRRRILVTGHTGFTGSWACLWLKSIGAEVIGFSLAPKTTPSLFESANIAEGIDSNIGDIRDYTSLQKVISETRPEIILHLAAQPLVRESYLDPLSTFDINAQGTAHVLEISRQTDSVRAVVCVTTDKVYKNQEWDWPYRENDPLGGKDPYSASKASAEMVIQSYSVSYPWHKGEGPAIAIARGGNIIGGGDWSADRLVPDFVRAVTNNTSLTLRYPDATRPWQHVLALVHGYMKLMAGLVSKNPSHYARAWNLGPMDSQQYSVKQVLEMISEQWQRPSLTYMDNPLPEAGALALDSSLAANHLLWEPVWDTRQVINYTAEWYRDFYDSPVCAREITLSQINEWRKGISE